MNRIAALSCTALVASLIAAAPAQADRQGQTGVQVPRQSQTTHAEFTLPGGPWAQVVGALEGTPAYGRYAYAVPPPSGSCRIFLSATARSARRYPSVGRHSVRLRPGNRDDGALRIEDERRSGAIRWWTGALPGHDAAAAGVQRMPAALRSASRRWLIYDVRITHGSEAGEKAACATHARRTGSRTVRSIVRTLKLADGPPVAAEPFVSA